MALDIDALLQSIRAYLDDPDIGEDEKSKFLDETYDLLAGDDQDDAIPAPEPGSVGELENFLHDNHTTESTRRRRRDAIPLVKQVREAVQKMRAGSTVAGLVERAEGRTPKRKASPRAVDQLVEHAEGRTPKRKKAGSTTVDELISRARE